VVAPSGAIAAASPATTKLSLILYARMVLLRYSCARLNPAWELKVKDL